MKIIYFLIFLFISNCSINKVVKHHGVHFLEKKQEKLIVKTSNKNDIIMLLGQPSTKSSFDNDLWIYIERKTSKKSLIKLGTKKIIVNNVLILEVDEMGMLVKKDFFNIDKMNKMDFSKNTTDSNISKRSFVYDFLSSLRQKINDPLGKRKKR